MAVKPSQPTRVARRSANMSESTEAETLTAGEMEEETAARPGAFFNDGRTPVDLVLAYEPSSKSSGAKDLLRRRFEHAVRQEGLRVEYEFSQKSTCFVKLNLPWPALSRQAEMEGIHVAATEADLDLPLAADSRSSRLLRRLTGVFKLQDEFCSNESQPFTEPFEVKNLGRYLETNRDLLFSPAQRVYLTYAVLSGIRISRVKKQSTQKYNAIKGVILHPGDVGLDEPIEYDPADFEGNKQLAQKGADLHFLLKCSVYSAAYPLHDCEATEPAVAGQPSTRRFLYLSWARSAQWHREQPLDAIRAYYGEKAAFYFAWLGLYTRMLVVPALVGLLVLVGGLATLPLAREDACDGATADVLLCRACPSRGCPFTRLGAECLRARTARVFDNYGTVLFALFMSLWTVVFLAQWKRYRVQLCARWDVAEKEFETEQVRFEYASTTTTYYLNPVTHVYEPKEATQTCLKTWRNVALNGMFVLICMVSVFGSVASYYGAAMLPWKHDTNKTFWYHPNIVDSFISSIINGILVTILSTLFGWVAVWLTESSRPRTERSFEKRLVHRVFLLEIVNYFGALVFLAFIRPSFSGPPMSGAPRCPATGCLLDVTIQLGVVFVGKQLVSNTLEVALPALRCVCVRCWRRRRLAADSSRWLTDLDLTPQTATHFVDDYLELLLQFAFVTLFVAAFPLAPLVALLNNIVEIRVDARKLLLHTRRLIPERASGIGPWFPLLEMTGKLAIITNGLLIAFTSEFVDRTVWSLFTSQAADSYRLSTLSAFDTADWCASTNGSSWVGEWFARANESDCAALGQSRDGGNASAVGRCFYRGYTAGAPHAWLLVALCKLAFVVVFEHGVLLVQTVVGYVIPDVPDDVALRLKRQAFLRRESRRRAHVVQTTAQEPSEASTAEEEDEQAAATGVKVKSASMDELGAENGVAAQPDGANTLAPPAGRLRKFFSELTLLPKAKDGN